MLRLEKEKPVIASRKFNRNFQFGFARSMAQNLPHMYRPQIVGSELVRIYGMVRGVIQICNSSELLRIG